MSLIFEGLVNDFYDFGILNWINQVIHEAIDVVEVIT